MTTTLAGRSARPAVGADGLLGAAGPYPGKFDAQDNRTVSIESSAWELGFEEPVEMYPDSPVEKQPDLWLVRRIEPETDVRIESKYYSVSI